LWIKCKRIHNDQSQGFHQDNGLRSLFDPAGNTINPPTEDQLQRYELEIDEALDNFTKI